MGIETQTPNLIFKHREKEKIIMNTLMNQQRFTFQQFFQFFGQAAGVVLVKESGSMSE